MQSWDVSESVQKLRLQQLALLPCNSLDEVES
jgi:hypothetical protein